MSDEWIVQFGGVLVELVKTKKKKKVSEQTSTESLKHFIISSSLSLSLTHTQNKTT